MKDSNKEISFAATGDSFITRRLSKQDFDPQVAALIGSADFRFTNLEITLHRNEGYPSALSGGTWAMADPEVLNDLKKYHFNSMTWANNHTLDYLYEGLQATECNLDKADIVHAGVGENLAAASSPKYVDCDSGRIALIGATSTFHDFWRAGEQRADMQGRPGINPLRYSTKYQVTSKNMTILREIAGSTDINAENNLAIKEGFSTDSDLFKFGSYTFTIGEQEGMVREPHPEDLQRMTKAIHEGKRQADYVIVSIHCHEMNKDQKDQAPDFLEAIARHCIDEGAHAVIGHGPHILRGVEIYKNRPIFYSLGNFIFQNDTVQKLPSDFYEQYNLPATATVGEALDKRSQNNTKGLGVNKAVWESVIPFWEMREGVLTSLKFYPIELGFGLPRYQRGWPKITTNEEVLKSLEELSKQYGTEFVIKDGMAEVILN
ncbi:CapA family protein [Bacillus sp. MRMR6]|uniref:CapA family protein n=1 Tax=Bacillus sp. MRMR6 TaxID=1928617 RepID=UPI0009512340|nr:CapA family protein [Bacillus sp. MRMR6]OLS39209.1 capsule biosynthesis protein [Bacillus sp. MRMR6]